MERKCQLHYGKVRKCPLLKYTGILRNHPYRTLDGSVVQPIGRSKASTLNNSPAFSTYKIRSVSKRSPNVISSHSLREIPPDTRAIFNTNILVDWVTDHPRFGTPCTESVKRVEKGEIQGVIPAIILNELLHRIMIAETVGKGYARTSQDAVRVLKDDPAIIKEMTIAGTVYDILPTIGFEIIEDERGISSLMYHFSKELCLMAKDAAIVAYAHTYDISHIVTNDRDFQRVRWLSCWSP